MFLLAMLVSGFEDEEHRYIPFFVELISDMENCRGKQ